MQYVLDVEKWICGGGSHNENEACSTGIGMSQMLNRDGYMCCLGQFAVQKGVSEKALRGAGTPVGASTHLKTLDETTIYDATFLTPDGSHTELAKKLMSVNDDRDTKVTTKISYIRRALKADGHSLKVLNLAKVPK